MASHGSKKRQRTRETKAGNSLDTYKPTAVYLPVKGRQYTLSIALPGSIIANAQSHDLKTALAGQIARALAVFCVDEVVVFDDGQAQPSHSSASSSNNNSNNNNSAPDSSYTGHSDPNDFLLHLLSYLETPPHLRKHLFPLHPNLRTAGTLPSLDMPHHLRAHEWCPYREGVTVATPSPPPAAPSPKRKRTSAPPPAPTPLTPTTVFADVGFTHPIRVEAPTPIPPNTRLTLHFPPPHPPPNFPSTSTPPLTATPTALSTPRTASGYYWGYTCRAAPSLSAIFTESPFDDGYDLTFGTSERGVPLATLTADVARLPRFRHMLVVFGGVAGLEVAGRADEELRRMGVGEEVREVFDFWVDVCPGQGSRTIRTEEAVWVGLMGLKGVVDGRGVGEGEEGGKGEVEGEGERGG